MVTDRTSTSGDRGDPKKNGRLGSSPASVFLAIVATLLVGAFAAGCGGSDGDSTSSGDAASGEPIKIISAMVLSGPAAAAYQPWLHAAEAGAAQINAEGGVKGHELEIVSCDMGSTASGSATCGQQAVTEKAAGYIAFGSYTNYLPILEQAGIPAATVLSDESELNSPISFSPTPGALDVSAGLAAVGHVDGCKKMVWIQVSVAGDQIQTSLGNQFTAAADNMGMESGVVKSAPQPDLSSVIASAMQQDPDCLAIWGLGADMVGMLTAIEETGEDIPVYTTDATVPKELLESVGPIGKKLKLVALTLPATEPQRGEVSRWLESQEKFGKEPTTRDGNGALVWSYVQMFARAGEQADEPAEASSMLEALEGMSDLETGITIPVSFDEPLADNLFGPRLFQPYVYREEVGPNLEPILETDSTYSVIDASEGPKVK